MRTAGTRRSSRLARPLAGGMLALAIGYFLWYTPYAALTKALSSGLLPGMDSHIGGLVLLPAAALGTLVGAPLFLLTTGWWRHLRPTRGGERSAEASGRTFVTAGFFTALVIATTTLNYTFVGVSILLMLLLMRAGVLVLSPVVDLLRRRPVRIYSWVALGLSLVAVVTAVRDVGQYHIPVAGVLTLGLYFTGYIGRFNIMCRVAKTGDQSVDRRYLAGEALSSAVWQVALCLALAVTPGAWGDAVREGLTGFLFSASAWPAFGIGLLYSALYVYGTLIYLDPREYTWCVPANRCASLLSGLVASFGLTWLTGLPGPGAGQLAATGIVLLAILALSWPAVRATLSRRQTADDRARAVRSQIPLTGTRSA